MKSLLASGLVVATAILAALNGSCVFAQGLAPNQTLGFANSYQVRFTYTQNYACVHEPGDDLDYNGTAAQSDPGEFQTPICQAAIEPTIDPAGAPTTQTAPLYVLVPMFSLDNDQNPSDAITCPDGVRPETLCGEALGNTLISLFGALPEAFKTTPLVSTQCPEPGSSAGTCTMHSSTIDLGKALVALGLLPPPVSNIFLPTPNHSHIVENDDARVGAIWWEVRPVLVTNAALWPSASGRQGISSVKAMRAAENDGDAIEVPSNFFLFFSSKPNLTTHS